MKPSEALGQKHLVTEQHRSDVNSVILVCEKEKSKTSVCYY